jgi:hypothetical protein
MCPSIELPCQTTLQGQLVEVGVVGIPNHVFVTLILLHHDQDVLERGNLAGLAGADILGKGASNQDQSEESEVKG